MVVRKVIALIALAACSTATSILTHEHVATIFLSQLDEAMTYGNREALTAMLDDEAQCSLQILKFVDAYEVKSCSEILLGEADQDGAKYSSKLLDVKMPQNNFNKLVITSRFTVTLPDGDATDYIVVMETSYTNKSNRLAIEYMTILGEDLGSF